MNNAEKRKEYITNLYTSEFMREYASGILEGFIINKMAQNKYIVDFLKSRTSDEEPTNENNENNDEIECNESMFSWLDFNTVFLLGDANLTDIMLVIAFFATCEDNGSVQNMRTVLKKAFKSEFNEVLKEDFVVAHSNFKNTEKLLIYLFILAFLNKDISSIQNSSVRQALTHSLYDLSHSIGTSMLEDSEIQELLPKTALVRERYFIKDIQDSLSLNDIKFKFVESTFNKAKQDKLDIDILMQNNIDFLLKHDDISDILHKAKQENKDMRFLEFVYYIVRDNLVNSFAIQNFKLNKRDIEETICDAYLSARKANLSLDRDAGLISIALVMRCIGELLRKNIEAATTATLDLEKHKYESKNTIRKLNSQLNKANTKIDESISKINSLEKRIAELEAENNNLKAKARKQKSGKKKESKNKKELEALRELFFNIEHEEIDECSVDNYKEETLEFDPNKKLAFVGSETYLHSRLSNHFSTCKFVHADDVNRDLNFLKNLDIVFLHTHMSHSMYYKVVETIKSTGTKLIFLNSTNTDILKKQIIESIHKI